MKKKITAFLLVFYIFAYTTICCYSQPVYASAPAVDFTLFDGFSTLLWSLGLGVVGVETVQQKQTLADVMDRNFTETLLGYDEETQSQYTEFCENVEHGYMLIGSKLWDFFKDYTFNEIENSNFFKNVPSEFSSFVNTYSGYYFLCYNAYLSSSLSNQKQIFCTAEGYDSNFTYVNPITLNQSWYDFFDYNWGTGATKFYSGYMRNGELSVSLTSNGTNPLTFRSSRYIDSVQYSYLGFHNATNTANANLTALTNVNEEDYDLILDGVWLDNGENITTVDGVIPQVINGDTIKDVVSDITSGQLTWQDSLTDVIENDYPENPAVPDIGLDLATLDSLVDGLQLERLESKFPFCIPHDLMLIMNGATAVSSNQAPVIEIPLRIEFNEHVYYDNDSAVVIDFNDFSGVVHIFREGFFLLFLIALMWVSIEILQAFFVVTE